MLGISALPISEFDLIARYFDREELKPDAAQSSRIPLGIGDDCALLEPPEGTQLALSTDTLVAGVHFLADADPGLIARRALAVNLSDLAAMGAEPLAFTLALTLPKTNEAWLESFSQGLADMVQTYRCPLIGGNISRGPLSITIQVQGSIEKGQALTRQGARPGDLVFVSGQLGAAGLATSLLINGMKLDTPDRKDLHRAYYEPQPRIALGRACVGLANAAIDISDGLLADMEHIARQSQVGVELEANKIPVAATVRTFMTNMGDPSRGLSLALTAGDDYELLLTLAPDDAVRLQELAEGINVRVTQIGQVLSGKGVRCLDKQGNEITVAGKGYRHF